MTIGEGSATLGSATANASGVWLFTPSGLADGPHTLVAAEVNSAGTGSASLSFTLDTTAPSATLVASGGVTHRAVQMVSGAVSDSGGLGANPLVTILDNGAEIASATASGGVWSASITFPSSGNNALTAVVTDLAGNSGASPPVAFTYSAAYIVSSGQDLVVASGETDTPIFVLSSGRVDVQSGGTAAAATISGGGLQLDDSQHFSGTVAGFGLPDQLDLVDIGFGTSTTSAFQEAGNNLSGTLTVTDGTHTANLTLLGQYVAGQFHLDSDGSTGTLVTDPPTPIIGSGGPAPLAPNPH